MRGIYKERFFDVFYEYGSDKEEIYRFTVKKREVKGSERDSLYFITKA